MTRLLLYEYNIVNAMNMYRLTYVNNLIIIKGPHCDASLVMLFVDNIILLFSTVTNVVTVIVVYFM